MSDTPTTAATTPAAKPTVLFVCVHNAGRSQMAAGWLRHLAGDGVEVFSGGSEPAETLNPGAVAAMGRAGRQRLEAEFSITRNVAETQKLYDRILAVPAV